MKKKHSKKDDRPDLKQFGKMVESFIDKSLAEYYTPVPPGGGEWFSIKDVLPSEGVPVEMKLQKGRTATCWHVVELIGGKWYSPDGEGPLGYPITHWRPMEGASLTA